MPLDRGSKLGAAGSTAGRGDAVPLHPARKGTGPLAPCPISAFHTTKHQLPFCQASLRFPATPRAQQRTKNHQAHFLQTLCFSRGSHHPPRCRLSLSLPILPASHGCARSLPNNIPPALQNPVLVHPACIHPALEGSRCWCRSHPGPHLLGLCGRSGLSGECGLRVLPGLGFLLLLGAVQVGEMRELGEPADIWSIT